MNSPLKIASAVLLALSLAAAPAAAAATKDLGNGFRHHGVASPISNHRGTVATVDGAGHDIVLSWLFDHRGGYALLLVDCVTGKSEEYPVPFPPGGDTPYASILSSGNKYYTHFNSWFSEFDPVKRAFTFTKETAPQMAMSMTEDDKGRIWSATYPKSGVVSFDPKTRELRDYGHVYDQNWNQYPRAIATDKAGWVYFGVGSTKSQIVALDPKTGQATPLIPEEKRSHGYPELIRELDGKVYGQFVKNDKGDWHAPDPKDRPSDWHAFFKGRATFIGERGAGRPKPFIAGSQSLFHREFRSGLRLKALDFVERQIVIEDPKAGTDKTFPIAYSSEGAHVMGVATTPDGQVAGGTAFPMRFFLFNPKTDVWTNYHAYGQYNTAGKQGDRFYAGCYTGGFLLEWDPAKPYVRTEPGEADSNPAYFVDAKPDIYRPHRLLCHPDGKTVIFSGTPDYGLTGGGVLFWDRATKTAVKLTHREILPEHSTMAMVALPKGKILAGTTIAAGTGGEVKAKEAELYLLDLATKKVEWHAVVFPGVKEYTDLCLGPKGLVYGFADRARFFVFDPVAKKVVHEEITETAFGPTSYQQGPRVFVSDPKGTIYVLFLKGIAKLEPKTHKIVLLAESPVPVMYGGDYLDGRIYYSSGSNLYSWEVR